MYSQLSIRLSWGGIRIHDSLIESDSLTDLGVKIARIARVQVSKRVVTMAAANINEASAKTLTSINMKSNAE